MHVARGWEPPMPPMPPTSRTPVGSARTPVGSARTLVVGARTLVVGAVVALLVVACSGPAPVTARQPDADTVAAAITEEGLRARLESLAAAAGTSGLYRAAGGAEHPDQQLAGVGRRVRDLVQTHHVARLAELGHAPGLHVVSFIAGLNRQTDVLA